MSRPGEDAGVRYLVVALLVACSSAPDDPPIGNDEDPAVDGDGKADGAGLSSDWLMLGTGVAYQHVNTGTAVLIAYGGYTARIVDSAAWATELVDQKLGALEVGHVYAVKGPADAAYAAREIANSKLRLHLLPLNAPAIYIVAHSSGSFVAHELLGQLHAHGDTDALARIAYADLDGGGSGLSDEIVGELGHVEFVYAKDPVAGLSRNSSTAISLAETYGPHATVFQVLVANTGCATGAGWCMHDVVITHRPHNPQSFDLARDYADFENRPVTTEYLDPLVE